jgi:hypothetical protein
LQIALRSFLVKGEERGRFEGKHGESRQERIRQGNLWIGKAMIWNAAKAILSQAKEGVCSKMLATFGCNDRHGEPLS